MHRRIAELMKSDPERVIDKAMRNLESWQERRNASASVFSEWLELIGSLSPEELAAFITSDSEQAIRMRQSSPFAGVIPAKEVWAIKRDHEAA